jgi:hypothetical protein
MVGVSLWLLATNTADPDELPGAGGVVHAES